ncbi:MAG TPA: isochorismate synthase [Chloroflexota bacterium]|nr:isochorismate synthase [Chloroflexota bacterium]
MEDIALAGVGRTWAVSTSGLDGVASAQIASASLAEQAISLAAEPGAPGPTLMGAFPFSPSEKHRDVWAEFEASELVLPELVLARDGGRAWLTVSAMITTPSDLDSLAERAAGVAASLDADQSIPDCAAAARGPYCDAPNAGHWKDTVEAALEAITSGSFEKVVLARRRDFDLEAAADPASVLNRLRDLYPETAILAVARGDLCFLGASPEPLAQVANGLVRVPCLAGSMSRGATEADDLRRAAALLADMKNGREHQAVVAYVRERLSPLTDDLRCGELGVLTFRNIHHLATLVEARTRGDFSILDAVRALHPTPAVGGSPATPALAFIAGHEGMTRGLFAGPVGWTNLEGEGDFAVAIRSALLRPGSCHLFAGCGIVAGSDPDEEWAETELKMQPMLSALGLA